MKTDNIVITIGRQAGSGGSMTGKAISERFGFNYIDKQFLVKAAEKLNNSKERLELVDEKSPLWAALAQNVMNDTPYIVSEAYYVPTSTQLFNIQTQIMKEAAEQAPCVIIGRCASHLFRNYPKHVSIFLQADMESRMERLERTLNRPVNSEKDRKHLEKEDKERARYYNKFTGKKWLNLTEYDFVLDTTHFTDEQIKNIIFNYIMMRFPELKIENSKNRETHFPIR